MLKILQEAVNLAFPTWVKSQTKFNYEMQDFKRVLDLSYKWSKDWAVNNLTFSTGFQILKLCSFKLS